MNDEELKRLWKIQHTNRRVLVDAEVLLQAFQRSNRQFISGVLRAEGLMVIVLVVVAAVFIRFGVLGLRQGLPRTAFFGFAGAALLCLAVACYKAWDRYRQLHRRPLASDPILACLEQSLNWLRHEMRLYRRITWWFLLPLGCTVVPIVLSIAWAMRSFNTLEAIGLLLPVIFVLGGRRFCNWYVLKYYEPRERELESLIRSLQ